MDAETWTAVGAVAALIAIPVMIGIYLHSRRDATKTQLTPPPVPETVPEVDLGGGQRQVTKAFNIDALTVPYTAYGRGSDIGRVVALLADGQRAVTVKGMGGIGKTVLAAMVAGKVRDRFATVWAVSFKAPKTKSGLLLELAAFLFRETEAQSIPAEKLEPAVRAGVAEGGQRLLIVDNFETVIAEYGKPESGAAGVRDLLDHLPKNVQMLITSRAQPAKLDGEEVVPIGGVERSPAVRIMRDRLAARKTDFSDTQLGEIAARLGWHPLACRLVASYLAESGEKPEAAIERVYEIVPKATDPTEADNLRSFQASLDLSLNTLNDDERKLLQAVSAFDGPFVDWAAAIVGGIGELIEDGETKRFEVDVEKCAELLRALENRSLLEPRRTVVRFPQVELFSLHPLVRETVRPTTDVEASQSRIAALADFIGDEIGRDRERSDIPFLVAVQEMMADLLNGARRRREDGVVAIGNLGQVLIQSGRYADAVAAYEECLPILDSPGRKRNLAACLHQIGMIHENRGEWDAAFEKYEESLKIRTEIGDRAGIAISLHQIGMIHQYRGEWDAALEKYEESLKIANEIGNRAGIASSFHQIGMIHENRGEWDAALEKYEESLKIATEIGDRAGIASSLHQIGNILYQRGEWDAALEKYEESLKILQEIGDRAGIAISLGQIGLVREEQGRVDEAIALTEQALAIFTEIGAHPEMEIAQRTLARLRAKTK